MGSPVRVLYVDADTDAADEAATRLEREDGRFTVEATASATAGLDRLDADFDCVVSEYALPDTDGLGFFDAVREEYPDVPFVLFTGAGSEAVAAEAVDAGVTSYVRKRDGTGQYGDLAERVREAVGQHRSQRRRDSQRREYEQLFEEAPVMFARVRAEGGEPVIEDCNDRFAERLGYDPEALRGRSLRELYTEESVARAIEGDGFERALAGELTTAERQFETASGDVVDVLARAAPWSDGSGDPAGTLAMYFDITERKERLRQLERYETVIDASGDPVYTLDADGTFTVVNDAFCEMTGYDEADVAGAHFASILTRADRLRGEEVVRSLRDPDTDRRTSELTVVCQDGTRVPCEIHITPLPTDDEESFRGTVGVIRDVSARKERERAVREQRERLQERGEKLIRLRNYTQDLTYADTPTETATVALNAIDEILGFDLGAVFTQSGTQEGVLDVVEILNRPQMEKMYGGIPVFLRDSPPGTHSELAWEVFETGESVFINDTAGSDRLARKSPFGSLMLYPVGDHGLVLLAATALEAFTETEEILLDLLAAALESAFDRLDRERELRRQRDALERQNERLEEFASVVSHDLRNPLQVADLRLELAREECDSDHLGDVSDALDRSQALVEDLLTLAREGDPVGESEPVDLCDVAEICWHTTATPDATLRTETDRTVLADRSRLQQLFENLYRNAVEHGGSDVTVTVGATEAGFYVEDDGPGISAGERESVFEGGYSTSDDGTGYGLRIVEQVATAHGWDVRVTDGTEGGARFVVSGVDFAR